MYYSVVAADDKDNRILYADGKCPSGRMIHTSTLIHWLAGGRKNDNEEGPTSRIVSHKTTQKFEEPKKPGFWYLDPKLYPNKRVRKA